jgi:hypothetical protein
MSLNYSPISKSFLVIANLLHPCLLFDIDYCPKLCNITVFSRLCGFINILQAFRGHLDLDWTLQPGPGFLDPCNPDPQLAPPLVMRPSATGQHPA